MKCKDIDGEKKMTALGAGTCGDDHNGPGKIRMLGKGQQKLHSS